MDKRTSRFPQVFSLRAGSAVSTVALLAVLMAESFMAIAPPPCRADSEASSESGSEAPGLGRRGWRWRRSMMMQSRQQSRQNRQQDMQHNKQLARQDQQRSHLTGRQTVHSYGTRGSQRRAQNLLDQKAAQGSGAQANASQGDAAAKSAVPPTHEPTAAGKTP